MAILRIKKTEEWKNEKPIMLALYDIHGKHIADIKSFQNQISARNFGNKLRSHINEHTIIEVETNENP